MRRLIFTLALLAAPFSHAGQQADAGITRDMAANRPVLAKHFDEVDRNRDGTLSRGEIKLAREFMLAQRKERESVSHRERIHILQIAESCIQAAATPAAYRACEGQERNSRKALREPR